MIRTIQRFGSWETHDDGVGHYTTAWLSRSVDGMHVLREYFARGPDEFNVVLFSTSGVHGTYTTIEEVEATLRGEAPPDEESHEVTFLLLCPRMCSIKYGNVRPKTLDDIAFLKDLRAKSHAMLARIGLAEVEAALRLFPATEETP